MNLPAESQPHRTLQLVAAFEAVKGLIVLGAGFGLLALLHRDARHVAEGLVTWLHIDPERRFAGVFVNAAARLTDAKLWGLAALALAYTALRWTEAYGLWRNRRWAAWLGTASGAIYVPVELCEIWHKPSGLKAVTLALNLGVVVYLLWTLRRAAETNASRP